MTILLALLLGFLYGNFSVKGQFCMNSGFSNVTRQKDTTKLKSFVAAILIQMTVLPLAFTVLYFISDTQHLVDYLNVPSLFLIGTAVGGFVFGVMMYYSAGCGAGIFYKIGERNSGALLAALGFIIGVYLTEKGLLAEMRTVSQNTVLIHQQPVWKETSSLLVAIILSSISAIGLFLLYRNEDKKPGGAQWGWKKTGALIGVLGVISWFSAILVSSPYGMSIIPGVIDIVELRYSWGLLFVVGIPLGAFWSTRKISEKHFTWPKPGIAGKRILGGLGLGISGSIAGGCTVGHGLTFSPFLGMGSIVGIIFIFIGSATVGYLTKK